MAVIKSKINEKALYTVTLRGLYNCNDPDGGGVVQKPYTETLKMQGSHVAAGVQYSFKRIFAPLYMAKKYPGYIGLAEHHIESVIDQDGNTPDVIDILNRIQLLQKILEDELPIESHLYEEDGQLRQAVKECMKDENAFLKSQDHKRETVGTRARLKDLAVQLLVVQDLNEPQPKPTANEPAPEPEKTRKPYERSATPAREKDPPKNPFQALPAPSA